ncbi:hypothetical protein ABDK00_012720 [Niabella insulamsoli]|uniref:hypothetical protein n=1 Tax=Niabella insulamsoli TaxID=3144874 RepID=UPI0031FE238C
MERNNTATGNLQQMITDNFQQLTGASLASFKPLLDTMLDNLTVLSRPFVNEEGAPKFTIPQLKLGASDDCCAPQETCPPHCIASITTNAMAGERVMVPFTIKNNCSVVKTYRVGVRELQDRDGQLATMQPYLNKNSVVLQPGASERVVMSIDLANASAGKTYTTEIVIREKAYNQNICFTLNLVDDGGTIVYPQDEKKYSRRWQSWKSHFYCEPKKAATVAGREG